MNTFPIVPANKNSLSKRKLIFGIGINDANYILQRRVKGKIVSCPFYKVWKAMLQRCYDQNIHKTQPTYIGCIVHADWHYFMSFRTWMVNQNWEGKQLDKDICGDGKLYSSEVCVFVDRSTNQLLTHIKSNKGEYSTGVSLHKPSNRFIAQCGNGHGVKKHLGYFDTEREAESEYIDYKSKIVMSVALRQEDNRVFIALIKVASDMRSKEGDGG